MAKKRLHEKQIAAIEYLALPKRGGMTYEQVADAVGVTRKTLSEWRKDEDFCAALSKRTVQVTQESLPDVLQASIEAITEEKNAAMFRTFVQMHGLLTEKHEVSSKESASDIDAVRAEIERLKQRKDG